MHFVRGPRAFCHTTESCPTTRPEGFPLCISYEVLCLASCPCPTQSVALLYAIIGSFIDRAGCNHVSAGGIKGVGKTHPKQGGEHRLLILAWALLVGCDPPREFVSPVAAPARAAVPQ